MTSSYRLSLGGLEIAIIADREILPPDDDAYREFVSAPATTVGPEAILVRLAVTPAPSGEGRVIFESEATWKMLAERGKRVVLDRVPSGARFAVHLEAGSKEVLVECAPDLVADGRALWCPVRYPVDQILAMYLLGAGGIVVHAAGMIVQGRAVVLAGVSGAGKSTFARLAAGRPGWEALSDDRVIVRLPDDTDEAVAYGTPWPGEGRIAANRSGPLARLVFLSQGSTNGVLALSRRQAAARLLATASIPWYDTEWLAASLDACERLVERVPAVLLTFRPEASAVDVVERLLDGDDGPCARVALP